MSYKRYDYVCINEECSEYNIKKDILVKDKEKDLEECEVCKKLLQRNAWGVSMIKTNDFNGKMH